MTPQTLLKVVAGAVATVVLGAIGSGVWERILAPALDGTFRASVDFLSTFSLNYKNGIYKAAAQGFHEDFSLRLFAIATLLMSVAALFFAMRWNEQLLRIVSPALERARGWLQWAAIVAALALSLTTLYSVGRHEAVNKTATYALRSLDVLRPHIGEQKYLGLLSQLYQVRSAAQFQDLNKSLVEQAQSFNVSLPEFVPL